MSDLLNQEQQIGALMEKVEGIQDDLKDFITESKRIREDLQTRLDTFEQTVREKFHTVEIIIKVLKWFGLTIVAVVSFKFGDVRFLWDHFFK